MGGGGGETCECFPLFHAISSIASCSDVLNWLVEFQRYLQTLSTPLAFGVNFALDLTQNYTSPEVATLIDTVDYVLDEKGFSNFGLSMPDEHEWLATHDFIEALQRKGKAYLS